MNTNLKGHNALVCGASQGIGAACAQTLAEQGARVFLLARDAERLEHVRSHLQNAKEHRCLALDILNRKALEESVQTLLSEFGPISILICNSGGPKTGPLLDAEDDVFLQAFSQHILANQTLVRLLLPGMKDKEYGRIINIISTSVKTPLPNLGVSNTIRAAVANWSKTLSRELASSFITVNNVLPGYTDTERLSSLISQNAIRTKRTIDEVKKDWMFDIPMRRFGTASEVAAAVGFLASPAASYVNGINFPVDGGRTPSL